jgi:hypothetical protein
MIGAALLVAVLGVGPVLIFRFALTPGAAYFSGIAVMLVVVIVEAALAD